MVDNFDRIKKYIDFGPGDGKFLMLQILQRNKEVKGAHLIKTYFIYSVDELDRLKDEIVRLCEENNARACINLSPKTDKKLCGEMLIELSRRMVAEDYTNLKNLAVKVAGSITGKPTRWIIDIDKEDLDKKDEIREFLRTARIDIADCFIDEIPTRSGCHFISEPFNPKDFGRMYPTIAIHKNNPTVLYIPDSLNISVEEVLETVRCNQKAPEHVTGDILDYPSMLTVPARGCEKVNELIRRVDGYMREKHIDERLNFLMRKPMEDMYGK